MSPRLRDRALDRLDGMTTGAAALGLVATAGFGTVAALTTHVAGVSAADQPAPVTAPDDNRGFQTTPRGDDDNPVTPTPRSQGSTSGGTRYRTVQPPSSGGTTSPYRAPHVSTGGS